MLIVDMLIVDRLVVDRLVVDRFVDRFVDRVVVDRTFSTLLFEEYDWLIIFLILGKNWEFT